MTRPHLNGLSASLNGSPRRWPSADAWGIDLVDPVAITHEGSLLLFARERGQPANVLYYNVRRPDPDAASEFDGWSGWYPLDLRETDAGGADLQAEQGVVPLLRVGGMTLVTAPPFAQAASAADNAFAVLSDDRYVAVVRLAADGSLYLNRFLVLEVPANSGDVDQEKEPKTAFRLSQPLELRFQRSKKKDVPESAKDTVGARTMDGTPFLEPTLQIAAPWKFRAGRFAVVIGPGGTGGARRWHFIAVDAGANAVRVVTLPDRNGIPDVTPATVSTFAVAPVILPNQGPALTAQCAGGVAACLFGAQEAISDATSARRLAHLMIAVPVTTSVTGMAGAHLVYDFTILPDGTLPPYDGSAGAIACDGTIDGGKFTPTSGAARYLVPSGAIRTAGEGTVASVVLGQVNPSAAPCLLEGTDGRVHLYVAGAAGTGPNGGAPFLALDYDPTEKRPIASVAWSSPTSNGTVALVGARPGTVENGMSVTVAASGGGDAAQADLCDLSAAYGGGSGLPGETWHGVPRRADLFARILNGDASPDPAASTVRSGAQPFFDYDGIFPTARLPLVTSGSPSGLLGIVARRTDVALASAIVAAPSGGTTTLTLRFVAGGQTVVQTWPSLPTGSASVVPILRGTAAPGLYGYPATIGDTVVVGLRTGGGTILLFAASTAWSKDYSLTVQPASGGNPDHADVTLTTTDPKNPAVLTNVDRDQAKFVAALRASAPFTQTFLFISPDRSPGPVADQAAGRLSLAEASTLFEVLPASGEGDLQAGTFVGSILQSHVVTGVAPDDTPDRLYALTAVLGAMPADGTTPMVANGAAAVAAGQNGAWLVAPPLFGLQLSGSNAMTVPVTGSHAEALVPQTSWSVEAWVNPLSGAEGQVLTYSQSATPPARTGDVVPTYLLGVAAQPCLHYASFTPGGPYAGSNVLVIANPGFVPGGDFTWEAWVKPEAQPAPANALGCIYQLQDASSPAAPRTQLGLDPSRTLKFGWRAPSGTETWLASTVPLTASKWSHVAVTAKFSGKTATLTLYLNARPVGSASGASFDDNAVPPVLYLGANDIQNVSVFGALTEVRFWQACRTQAEIFRTMETTLLGYEAGLFGYWPLVSPVSQGATMPNGAKATGPSLHGTLKIATAQAVTSLYDGTFFSMVAGIGGLQPVVARAFMQTTRWNHLAATFRAGTGIELTSPAGAPPPYADCGADRTFDLGAAATLECWVQAASSAVHAGTMLAKWGLAENDQGYQLGLDGTGTPLVTFAVTTPGAAEPTFVTAKGLASVADGKPHHLAAVFGSSTTSDDKGKFTTTVSVLVYVDGKPQGTGTQKAFAGAATAAIQPSKGPLVIGVLLPARLRGQPIAIESQLPYDGIITGVRLWSTTLTAAAIAKAYEARDAADTSGGIAAWWFREGVGRIAVDDVGGFEARLTGTDLWAPFLPHSRMTCYGNGRLLGQVSPAKVTGYGGPAQFSVGADWSTGSPVSGLPGQVDELRLWNIERSESEILDAMYRPLAGSEDGLAGYWRFEQNAQDSSGNGNDGTLRGSPLPTYAPSTAPVASEAPWVRLAYGGAVTDSQQQLSGTPAVVDYTDIVRRLDGKLAGVVRRGYYFVADAFVLPRGFGLGTADLVYLGQVQTDPTLIGYVEGPPPVPSENLSRPFYGTAAAYSAYFNASSLTLTETQASTFTFSSSKSSGVVGELAGNLGVLLKGKKAFVLQFPFLGTIEIPYETETKIVAKTKVQWGLLATETSQAASGWTDTISDAVALRGRWEAAQTDTSKYINPTVGRMFLPSNEGYALVESLTADLYGVRLKGRANVSGTVVVPNPLIPPDRNIITFQIAPRYTKNGTLDGKVGFYDDPAYRGADETRGSYFKPVEAYVLKGRIERDREALAAFYSQMDATGRGKSGDASIDDTLSRQFYDWDAGYERQSFVNGYVWSSSGGLHREQEQVVSRRSKSYGGTYKLVAQGGLGVEYKMVIASIAGPTFGIDLLAGQQIDVTVTKARDDQEGFGLDAAVLGESLLEKWDAKAQAYEPGRCPGKVDGYRFMTFYLAPDTRNAEDFLGKVVDQDWLWFGSDPNAVALRSANLAENRAWRVFHRVTYVSRVPPDFDDNPAENPSAPVQQPIQVAGNEALVALVRQALAANPPTVPNLGKAVLAVLDPPEANGNYPPSLLGTVLPWWEAFLKTTRGGSAVPAAVSWLHGLDSDVLAFIVKGVETGVISMNGAGVHTARRRRRGRPRRPLPR